MSGDGLLDEQPTTRGAWPRPPTTGITGNERPGVVLYVTIACFRCMGAGRAVEQGIPDSMPRRVRLSIGECGTCCGTGLITIAADARKVPLLKRYEGALDDEPTGGAA